ncbi:hypothetical protein, partial [Aeromonas rivipollensis]|uniref:hypothetical protein n=1 Tax=Aeromonas rivipollensis TaxID=948519 RepID=UPI003D249D7E
MTRATLPGVAIRQQNEWPEPYGLGPLGQKGALFDPHQTVALPAKLQLDNLGGGHGIDPGHLFDPHQTVALPTELQLD